MLISVDSGRSATGAAQRTVSSGWVADTASRGQAGHAIGGRSGQGEPRAGRATPMATRPRSESPTHSQLRRGTQAADKAGRRQRGHAVGDRSAQVSGRSAHRRPAGSRVGADRQQRVDGGTSMAAHPVAARQPAALTPGRLRAREPATGNATTGRIKDKADHTGAPHRLDRRGRRRTVRSSQARRPQTGQTTPSAAASPPPSSDQGRARGQTGQAAPSATAVKGRRGQVRAGRAGRRASAPWSSSASTGSVAAPTATASGPSWHSSIEVCS